MSGGAQAIGGQGVQTVGVAGAMGSDMAEQMTWSVVEGRKGAGRVVSIAAAATEVREGTTGRVVSTLPRVWAVASTPAPVTRAPKPISEPKVEVGFYRKYTEALLRRYMQMSMEAGRVPSGIGRSVIGGRASSYRIHGFDDAVIFRLDVEKCLRKLQPGDLEVVRRVAMQEYTQAEAAALMGICLRTCVQRYGRAMDRFTSILLEARLLEPFKALSSGRY